MNKSQTLTIPIIASLFLVFNCSSNPSNNNLENEPLDVDETFSNQVFEMLPTSLTGVEFNNELVETEEF